MTAFDFRSVIKHTLRKKGKIVDAGVFLLVCEGAGPHRLSLQEAALSSRERALRLRAPWLTPTIWNRCLACVSKVPSRIPVRLTRMGPTGGSLTRPKKVLKGSLGRRVAGSNRTCNSQSFARVVSLPIHSLHEGNSALGCSPSWLSDQLRRFTSSSDTQLYVMRLSGAPSQPRRITRIGTTGGSSIRPRGVLGGIFLLSNNLASRVL